MSDAHTPAVPPGLIDAPLPELRAGDRVRVTQQIAARHYSLATPTEGVVVSFAQRPTGSWYAHGARDKLWLDRVVLRKDDGEVTTLNLDAYSRVEVVGRGVDALER